MAYTPQWERLSDALTRVMEANGLAQSDAQTVLCQAIADRAVRVRAKLGRHTTKRITSRDTVLEGREFQIPPGLNLGDLDWRGSRPVKPWLLPRESFRSHGYWDLEWIELFRTDVTDVLCTPVKADKPDQRASSKRRGRSRSRPAFERAQCAVKAVYPDGAPGQAIEPNPVLCRRIGKWLKDNHLPDVSDDTILRAARRRK